MFDFSGVYFFMAVERREVETKKTIKDTRGPDELDNRMTVKYINILF